MSKKKLSSEQKHGLTGEQIAEIERYLRQPTASGAIDKQEASPIYELFLIGYSTEELAARFPQYSKSRILYTAAAGGWVKDKERLASSIYDRIRARIIRSTVEQVEFLTDMITVSSVENADEIRKFLDDPKNNPLPNMRIKNFKEYQQVIDTLAKVTDSVRSLTNPNAQQEARVVKTKSTKKLMPKSEEAMLLEQLVQVDDDGQ